MLVSALHDGTIPFLLYFFRVNRYYMYILAQFSKKSLMPFKCMPSSKVGMESQGAKSISGIFYLDAIHSGIFAVDQVIYFF